ncbi:MAG: YvcK family protein [Chloroflexi bacterium]|nr:YvcK family protein [Chloroflexota bacterium]
MPQTAPGSDKTRIVVIGGGTGSFTVLTGLKRYSIDLAAVVAMTDSGGSSGILRDEFGHLPPGDVRQCLVALTPDDRATEMLRHLFNYRFDKGAGLDGHSFGNLFLTALTEITGSADRAIAEAGRILGIVGRVIPVTLTKSQLCARLVDGSEIVGEANIDVRKDGGNVRIDYVYLTPKAFANPVAVQALEAAHAIVIGPGDLYTSIIPNLLVEGVSEAIERSQGKRIYVCNLMTKHSESDGFKASDFVHEVLNYLGPRPKLDYVLLNNSPFPQKVLHRYALQHAQPVAGDGERCRQLVGAVVEAPLLAAGTLLRHDAAKLAAAIMAIATREHQPAPAFPQPTAQPAD